MTLRQDDSTDMGSDGTIWEVTVSIWEMTVSIWDILSLCYTASPIQFINAVCRSSCTSVRIHTRHFFLPASSQGLLQDKASHFQLIHDVCS